MNPAVETPPAAYPDSTPALARLPRELLGAITAAADRKAARTAILRTVIQDGSARAVAWLERDENGQLVISQTVPETLPAEQAAAFAEAAQTAALQACHDGVVAQTDQPTSVVVAPVFLRGLPPEAVALQVDPPDFETSRPAAVLSATHASLADLLSNVNDISETVRSTSAILEILDRIEQAEDTNTACGALADQLQRYFECPRVVVSLHRQGRSRVMSLSRAQKFDRHSELAHAVEAAQNETLLRRETTVYPPGELEQRHALRAHKRLASFTECPCVVTIPLLNTADEPIGSCTLLGEHALLAAPSTLRFLDALAAQAALSLDLVMSARRTQWSQRLAKFFGRRTTLWCLVAVGLLAMMLCVPFPYRVKCDCELQPVTRRYVAAPYDAKLDKAFVGPGDVVVADDVLAQVDGREMRWELDGVLVDYDRARKKYDAALSKQTVSDAQLAKLEMDRLQLRRQLLEHCIQNLDIKSPVTGIVLSGDLERTEGAPLKIGQTLFAIAPLEKMVIELAVPESEVSHILRSDDVGVTLDAYPMKVWTGTVDKIHPRAQLLDNDSVFIAEVAIDNSDGQLRPGMKGRAKVIVRPHALGWNLFHQPWEAMIKAYHGM
jgi:hypothetical protein